jgi:hypothetical protein
VCIGLESIKLTCEICRNALEEEESIVPGTTTFEKVRNMQLSKLVHEAILGPSCGCWPNHDQPTGDLATSLNLQHSLHERNVHLQ